MAALRFAFRLRSLACQHQHVRLQTHIRPLASARPPSSLFSPLDAFPERHIGPDDLEVSHMLSTLGYDTMDTFVQDTVPSKIRVSANSVSNASIPAFSEAELHAKAKELGGQNKPFKSYIGMGYHNAVVPPVILRNVSFAHLLYNMPNCLIF
jgi:glycine dehydrogenase